MTKVMRFARHQPLGAEEAEAAVAAAKSQATTGLQQPAPMALQRQAAGPPLEKPESTRQPRAPGRCQLLQSRPPARHNTSQAVVASSWLPVPAGPSPLMQLVKVMAAAFLQTRADAETATMTVTSRKVQARRPRRARGSGSEGEGSLLLQSWVTLAMWRARSTTRIISRMCSEFIPSRGTIRVSSSGTEALCRYESVHNGCDLQLIGHHMCIARRHSKPG